MSVTCSGCGEVNADGAIMCTMCGMVLKHAATSPTFTPVPPGGRPAPPGYAAPPSLPGAPPMNSPLARRSMAQNDFGTSALQASVNQAAYTYYAIAGLSAVNTLLYFLHINFQFNVGMATTQVFDVLGSLHVASWCFPVSIVIILSVAAIGFFVSQRSQAAHIAGIVLYILDMAVLLIVLILLISISAYLKSFTASLSGAGGMASLFLPPPEKIAEANALMNRAMMAIVIGLLIHIGAFVMLWRGMWATAQIAATEG
jgi:hypothetical protein